MELCDCNEYGCPHTAINFKSLAADPRVCELARHERSLVLLVYLAMRCEVEGATLAADRVRSEGTFLARAGELFPLTVREFRAAVAVLARRTLVVCRERDGQTWILVQELAETQVADRGSVPAVRDNSESAGSGEEASRATPKRAGYLQ